MRIISGKARGMRLKTPPSGKNAIRPTSERCREALFSILGDRVTDAHVLDLFAGTGAFGLEAMSRGAASVVLVDCDRSALQLMQHNLALVSRALAPSGDAPRAKVIKSDLRKGVDSVITMAGAETVFDLIFLDPPYDRDLARRTLEHLGTGSLLSQDGLVIAEERSGVELPQRLKGLVLMQRRRYGDTAFWLYAPEAQP